MADFALTEELAAAIGELDRLVPDSRDGLPELVFFLVSRMTPLVNVDLLVENNEGEKLLIWRHDDFYGPGWHIPGGIVRFKETMADRLAKVSQREVGCSALVLGDCLQVTEIRCADRDVRGHFISHLFRCRLVGEPDPARRAGDEAPKHGQWAWFRSMPETIIAQHRRFGAFFDGQGPIESNPASLGGAFSNA